MSFSKSELEIIAESLQRRSLDLRLSGQDSSEVDSVCRKAQNKAQKITDLSGQDAYRVDL